MSQPDQPFYIAGGTMRYDAPSYVERAADRQLLDALRRGEFCYVLTSRQMGKSSLMVRTAHHLRQEGIRVVILDLSAMGENQSAQQWYRGLLDEVGLRLEMEEELAQFWRANRELGPLRRWLKALREVVLSRIGARPSVFSVGDELEPNTQDRAPNASLVIFIDEIDAVRSLPFSTDEFFAGIRECYNRRAEDPAFVQLTFCLLGVASPSDLIRDARTTPFNTGRRIELTDFTEAEAAPLARGFGPDHTDDLPRRGQSSRDGGEERALLRRVLHWTGGHPYLTQRLCQAMVAAYSGLNSPQSFIRHPRAVDQLCAGLFLSPSVRTLDDNLLFVRDRLLRTGADPASLLELYDQVRRGRPVPDDDSNSLVQSLRLSGVVKAADGSLHIRNRIYARVFDRQWVRASMPDAELRRQRAAYRRGLLRSASVAAILITLISALALSATSNERQSAQRLVRLHVYQGWQLADAGDLLGSLPWFAEALALDRGDPEREHSHRVRLATILRQCPRLIQAWVHGNDVRDVDYSPDGRWIVTGSRNRTARVWDAETGRPVSPPVPHLRGVIKVSFSGDGRRIVSTDSDTVLVWEALSGRVIIRIKCEMPIDSVTLSPDGHRLVTANRDMTARLWDATTGQPVTPPLRHRHWVTQTAFSPDGRRFVTACRDGTFEVRNADNGEIAYPALNHLIRWDSTRARSASFASFSPDGRLVVTASSDQSVRLWDTATGRPVRTFNHDAIANLGVFSPDGRRLVTSCEDGTVWVWDVETGTRVLPPLHHPGWNAGPVMFSRDGRLIVTGGGGMIQIWDAATGHPVVPPLRHNTDMWSYPAEAWGVAISPDGQRIVTADGRIVRMWNLVPMGGSILPIKNRSRIFDAAFSPDGRRVVIASFSRAGESEARVWEIDSGRPITPPLLHPSDAIWHTEFSPDGRRLLTSGANPMVRVWDVVTGRLSCPPLPNGRFIHDAEFSRDGQHIVTAGENGTARVWNAITGRPVTQPLQHGASVQHASFTADGRRILTTDIHGVVRFWDVGTGRLFFHTTWPGIRSFSGDYSPDGRRILTVSEDGTARVWDADTRRPLTPTFRQRGKIGAARFSPDGRLVVTIAEDQTARVWDSRTGEPVTPILRYGSYVMAAAFSPDSRRLLLAGAEADLHIWDLTPDRRPAAHLQDLAELLAGQRIDSPAGLEPLETADLGKRWRAMRAKYPNDFRDLPRSE